MNKKPTVITKILTKNDTGETGGHQAGICVPKKGEILNFFPDLGNDTKNPRAILFITDEAGQIWKFSFIYYNNKFFDPNGTRNEYRLTGMSKFMRQNGLKAGDSIILKYINDQYEIFCIKKTDTKVEEILNTEMKVIRKVIVGSEWRVIE